MNKKITLDVLAGMVQEGFLEMGERIGRVEMRIDALEKRMDGFEKRMDRFEKRVNSLEERMENGFYNIMQEIQQIKKLIKQVDTREQVAALEVRVNVIEKKIGI